MRMKNTGHGEGGVVKKSIGGREDGTEAVDTDAVRVNVMEGMHDGQSMAEKEQDDGWIEVKTRRKLPRRAAKEVNRKESVETADNKRWRSKRKEKVASASGGDGAPNVETERISPSRKATEDADEEFDFVEADFYEREAQPFSLGATRGALLLMDFHAHLTEDEVIGFLAGTYDADDTSIRVVDTFPCRSLPADDQDHSISVEMDPTSEVEVRREILECGLQVVGWYHSHPTFKAQPSVRDVRNQSNYQALFRCMDHGAQEDMEPFVGAIVSPYDPALRGEISNVAWFHAARHPSNEDITPHLLSCELIETEPSLDVPGITTRTERCMFEVLSAAGGLLMLDQPWRHAKKKRLRLSYLEKMRMSLQGRVSEEDVDGLAVVESLVTNWQITLSAARGSST